MPPATIAGLGEDDLLLEIVAAHGSTGIGRAIGAGERAGALLGLRVLFGATDPCGECDTCRRGGAPVCPLARHRTIENGKTIVAARWAVTLDNGLELPPEIAAHVPGDLALAYTLYARSNLAPREPTIVLGRSVVARYVAQILRAKGIEPTVIGTQPISDDTITIEPGPNLRDRVLASFTARAIGARPWRIVATDLEFVAELAGPRSQLTILATGEPLPAVLADREVTIITVARAHPDLVVEVAAMCVKGELKLDQIRT